MNERNQAKPLATFCIGVYNQEAFVKETVESALNQDYENLEIIISDDASTDRTYEIAKEMIDNYKGPHKIILNRNEHNLGIREHCNKILYDMSHGEYLILGGGDDLSSHDRTRKYVEIFEKYPQVMSISCKSLEVDRDLKPIDCLNIGGWDGTNLIYSIHDYIKQKDFILKPGDSRGLRRKVVTAFPRLEKVGAEDIYLFVRSLYLGLACFIQEPLVTRRHHGNNAHNKRLNKNELRVHDRQLHQDLKYAKKQNFITPSEYRGMKKKLRSLFYIFQHTMTIPYFSIPFFLFRAKRWTKRTIGKMRSKKE